MSRFGSFWRCCAVGFGGLRVERDETGMGGGEERERGPDPLGARGPVAGQVHDQDSEGEAHGDHHGAQYREPPPLAADLPEGPAAVGPGAIRGRLGWCITRYGRMRVGGTWGGA
jgi:hypothetical protein